MARDYLLVFTNFTNLNLEYTHKKNHTTAVCCRQVCGLLICQVLQQEAVRFEISGVFKIKCFKYLMAFSCWIEFCQMIVEFKLELIYVDHSR